jgi:hypothetical protein
MNMIRVAVQPLVLAHDVAHRLDERARSLSGGEGGLGFGRETGHWRPCGLGAIPGEETKSSRRRLSSVDI